MTLSALPSLSGIPGLSGLSFATPTWLLLGALLPLLLLAYRRRKEVRKKIVSTLFLLREVSQRQPTQNRIRLPWRFFVELLILILLLLAASSPSFEHQGERVALLLDSSLSMNATKRETSRFQQAIQEAETILNNASSSSTFSIFLSAPKLTLIGDGARGKREARELLATLKPSLASDTLISSVMHLASSGEYDELFVLSDKSAEYLPIGSHEGEVKKRTRISTKTIGGELLSNYFLTNVRLEGGQGGEKSVVVGVAFSGASTAEIVVKLFSAQNSMLGKKTVSLANDRSTEIVFPATGEQFRVELSHFGGKPLDSIQEDNTGWISGGVGEKKEVLLVTPFSGLGERFAPIPGVRVKQISPEQYAELSATPSTDPSLNQYALVLFHQTTPLSLPAAPTLFVLPPAESPIVRASREIVQPRISSWADDHPVMTYLRVANFQPERVALLESPPWTRSILNVESGPILVGGEQGGRRLVAAGFELLPFEGSKTPFLSVLTLNIFSWLSSVVSTESALLTGASLQLTGSEILTLPNGETLSSQTAPVTLNLPGMYRLLGEARSETFAVNALHPEESNTFLPSTYQVPREVSHEELPRETKGRVWWYLVAGAAALVIVDIVLLLFLSSRGNSSKNHGRKLHRLYT